MSSCPHCTVDVSDQSLYCEQCGRAVRVEPHFPRFVDSGKEFATSAAGQTLQAGELLRQAKSASGALIAVGALTGLAAVFFYAVFTSGAGPRAQDPTGAVMVLGALAALFIGLGVWARRQPFPATVTGLVIYVTLQVVGLVVDPASAATGLPVRVIIILVLIRAVKAGAMHRKLAARMDPGDRERAEG